MVSLQWGGITLVNISADPNHYVLKHHANSVLNYESIVIPGSTGRILRVTGKANTAETAENLSFDCIVFASEAECGTLLDAIERRQAQSPIGDLVYSIAGGTTRTVTGCLCEVIVSDVGKRKVNGTLKVRLDFQASFSKVSY